MTDESVLVVASDLPRAHGVSRGFYTARPGLLAALGIRHHARPRSLAEPDTSFKQLVSLAVIRRGGLLHVHWRGTGEARLAGRASLLMGGHAVPADARGAEPWHLAAMRRELAEELFIDSPFRLSLAGVVDDDTDQVGRTHLGLVYLLDLGPAAVVTPRAGQGLRHEFMAMRAVAALGRALDNWSRHVLHWLASQP